jgi:hypothetical protein
MSKKKQSKILKEEEKSLLASSNHISNDADNYLSKDMVKFVEHAVDPKHAPVGLRPSPSSQYTGLCQKLPVLARGTFAVGAQKFGVLSVSPSNCLGCSDRRIGIFSNTLYTGTASSPVPINTSSVGTDVFNVAKAPFSGATLTANDGDLYNALVNACAVYVKPIGSATTQNGRIFLLEVPGHPGNGISNLTLQGVMDHPRTRVIDAVQLGTPGFQNVLNWHPQTIGVEGGAPRSDNEFAAPTSALTDIQRSELIIVVAGDSGTEYEFEVYASYACRGSLTQPTTPMYTDPLGWAAYMNAVADKRISGWVGTAHMATSLYKGFVSKSHRRLLPKSEQELEKARARLDEEKARKGSAPTKTWFQSMKDLAPVAKEMGGFLLNLL